jgi:hypothetical protein
MIWKRMLSENLCGPIKFHYSINHQHPSTDSVFKKQILIKKDYLQDEFMKANG